MKVFLSWSGSISQHVAIAVRDWLPSVLQVTRPYVSSEDIDKGARWGSDLSHELDDAGFGILCVTRSNVGAPWLNFEAGALSRSFDRARVSPLLLGMTRADLPSGPLVQFQSTLCEREDMLKLVIAINDACGDQALEHNRLARIFDVWWPNLEQELRPLLVAQETEGTRTSSAQGMRPDSEILPELLELSRAQHRLLVAVVEDMRSVAMPGRALLEDDATIRELASIREELQTLDDLSEKGEARHLVERLSAVLSRTNTRVTGRRTLRNQQ